MMGTEGLSFPHRLAVPLFQPRNARLSEWLKPFTRNVNVANRVVMDSRRTC